MAQQKRGCKKSKFKINVFNKPWFLIARTESVFENIIKIRIYSYTARAIRNTSLFQWYKIMGIRFIELELATTINHDNINDELVRKIHEKFKFKNEQIMLKENNSYITFINVNLTFFIILHFFLYNWRGGVIKEAPKRLTYREC